MVERVPLKRKSKGLTRTVRLSAQQKLFAREYCKDFKPQQAAIRAGRPAQYAAQWAAYTIGLPKVQQEIERLQSSQFKRLDLTIEDIARYWHTIATADARELSPVRVAACRYCYGHDHRYQYTLNEMRDAARQHLAQQVKLDPKHRRPFDDLGGAGYDPNQRPYSMDAGFDHNCPECHGHGIWHIVPIALDRVSPAAAALFNGIKIGRDGSAEIKYRDRDRAWENLQAILGLVKPKLITDPSHVPEDVLDDAVQKAIDAGLVTLEDLRDGDLTIDGEYSTEDADAEG